MSPGGNIAPAELLPAVHIIDGEVIPPKDHSITVVSRAHPFSQAVSIRELDAGSTLQDILEEVQPDGLLRAKSLIWIGDQPIKEEYWHLVRPKPGTRVYIRCVPMGGGGKKSPFIIMLQIVVIAASILVPAAMPVTASQVLLTVGSATLTVGQLISSAILLAGGLLISMLAKPPKSNLGGLSSTERDSPTLFISGTRNQFQPFGVIPKVLGRHRMVPPYGALPFTESAGEDQYARLLFCFGYGPLSIDRERIGESLLTDFEDIETEFRRGYQPSQITEKGNWDASGGTFPSNPEFGDRYMITVAGNINGRAHKVGDSITYNNLNGPTLYQSWDLNEEKPMKLYPSDVFEEALSIVLHYPAEWSVRTTKPEADEISVDIAFNQGLVEFDDTNGDKLNRTVELNIEASIAGANDWTVIQGLVVTANQTNVLTRTVRWVTPERAQYDVRIQRVTPESDDTSILDQSVWAALRTFKNDDPIKMDGLCRVAMRIKATEQLSGVVDQYNAIVQSILPVWDEEDQVWDYRATSSPASCYREVLQGVGNGRPLADGRLHFASIKEWSEFCRLNSFEFNMVRDFSASLADTLDNITSCGRASKGLIDNKWGVVMDKPQTVPVQHFTPRNSHGFEGTRAYPKIPHAFRIEFVNRDKDWTLDQISVFDDGYAEVESPTHQAAEFYEDLDFPGITHANQIWKDGRFHLAQMKLRLDRYTLHTDIEYLVADRGSLVLVSHDVLSIGLAQGRIKELHWLDPGPNTTLLGITMDEEVDMEFGSKYGVSMRTLNDVKMTSEIIARTGSFRELTFKSPLIAPNVPDVGDLVTFGELENVSLQCLVLSIEPEEDEGAKLTLVDYAPGVYLAETGEIPDYQAPVSQGVSTEWPGIVDVRSDEQVLIVNPDGSWAAQIQLSLGWVNRRPTEVTGIQARYRLVGSEGSWMLNSAGAQAAEIALPGVLTGNQYEFQVRFLKGVIGGDWGPLLRHTVIGPSTPPPDVQNLRIENNKLYWDYPEPPRDFLGFKVKYHRLFNTHYGSAIEAHIETWPAAPFDLSALPAGVITLMVKAVDLAENESVEADTLARSSDNVIIDNVIHSRDYAAEGFPGDITNGTVDGTDLEAAGAATYWAGVNGAQFWSGNPNDIFWSSIFAEMIYEFTFAPGSESSANDFLVIVSDIQALAWTMEYKVDGISLFWTGVDSTTFWTGDSNLMWDSDGMFSPMPGIIEGLYNATYTFRLTVMSGVVQGIIRDLQLIAAAPTISEDIQDYNLAAIGSRLPITKIYRTIRSVIVSLNEDLGAAQYTKVIDKNVTSGPLVQAFDSTATGTTAQVDAYVQGY